MSKKNFNILSLESLVPQMITCKDKLTMTYTLNNYSHVLLTALCKFISVSKEPFNHLNFMCSQSCFISYCEAFLYIFGCVWYITSEWEHHKNTAFIYKEKFCQVYRIQSSADSIDFVTSQRKYLVLFNVRYSFANPAWAIKNWISSLSWSTWKVSSSEAFSIYISLEANNIYTRLFWLLHKRDILLWPGLIGVNV